MLICPISGFKMRSARVKGGTFWYCPYSRGRLLTLEMAKHFIGQDAAREIWVRSEVVSKRSEYLCSSCTKPMRLVSESKWLSGGEIDVCRSCHLIWFKPDTHPEIPHPEDLTVPEGDSTLVRDRGMAIKELLLLKENQKEQKEAIVGAGPSDLFRSIPGFFGLPVKMPSHLGLDWNWLTGVATITLIGVHWFFTAKDATFIQRFGFCPSKPFDHLGGNAIMGTFLHGDWAHLVFNLYFFLLFSADVEETLGSKNYLFFWGFAALVTAMFSVVLTGSPNVPHIGLSGIVMAMMAYYTLRFPHSRLAYLAPGLHSLFPGRGGSGLMFSMRWFRLPVWIVTLFFFGRDLFFYIGLERTQLTHTSHSSHLGGVVAGVIFWALFSKQKKVNLR